MSTWTKRLFQKVIHSIMHWMAVKKEIKYTKLNWFKSYFHWKLKVCKFTHALCWLKWDTFWCFRGAGEGDFVHLLSTWTGGGGVCKMSTLVHSRGIGGQKGSKMVKIWSTYLLNAPLRDMIKCIGLFAVSSMGFKNQVYPISDETASQCKAADDPYSCGGHLIV